jgi:hypothetical protein
MDLISANYDKTLSVLTNNGSGGFFPCGTCAVGNSPGVVTSADINGDDKLDLICANRYDNTLSVLTNNGSGGFVLASTPSVGWHPAGLVAVDVNGDGKVDLVSANQYALSVSVLTNNSTGGFLLAGTFTVGSGPGSVTAADVNGDGKMDLVTANYDAGTHYSSLTILTNNGGGGFVLASSPVVGLNPYSVIAGDVNGDGKVDLITPNQGDNTLTVLTNDGSGGFVLASSLNTGSSPTSVAATDVNGDGKLDLISANYNDDNLSVLTNATVFPPPPQSGSVTVVITPAAAVNAGAQWALDGGAWQNSGDLISNVPTGIHPISYSPVAGWFRPNSPTVTVVSGQTTKLGATYDAITQQPSDQVVTNGGTVTFSVAVSGTGPFTYRWLFNSNAIATTGIITTVAGNGTQGYSGDGGTATNASLHQAGGTAVDASGDLFIADTWNNRIRKVSAGGIITTVAGGGTGAGPGIFGDGGAATNASLSLPTDVAFDMSGNLLVSDKYHNRIRKVDANGIITTIAGNGTSSGWGSGSFSGDGGAATNAGLNNPNSMALDAAGNLFFADLLNARIRKVDTNGIITTVAGNGMTGFSGDGGVATNATFSIASGLIVSLDAVGNQFIADADNSRIRKVDVNGIITTVAGSSTYGYSGDGGPATNAALWRSVSVTSDAFGNLFISDYLNNRIRKVDTHNIITTAAGNGTVGFFGDGGAATNAIISGAASVKSDGMGNLYISDDGNNRIRKVSFSDTPILTLNNVTTNNAGKYQVIITSPCGCVTSSVASLTVVIPPRTATATAIVAYNSFVVAVTNLDNGFGYTNTPLVRIIGGGGNGATAVAVVSNGVVMAINITSAGLGYTNTPLVVIEPPFIPNPILEIAPMSFLSFSNLTVGGDYQLQQMVLWYWTNETVSFTTTNSLYAQMVAGVVGSGSYRLALNPVPSQAFATSQVDSGFVVGATVTSGGSGYVTSPTVTIVGQSVVRAGAYSSISGGVVTGITVTNAGYGYTNTPTIQIAPPPAAAVFPSVQPVMRVDSVNLAPYDGYQIQFMPAVGSAWQDWNGGRFVPTGFTNSQFLFITNDTGFFQLKYLGIP